jgi:uncharacterized protein (DUF1800 family)
MPSEALRACHRFGMGARPGDIATVSPDPRGWLHAQRGVIGEPAALSRLPSSAAVAKQIAKQRGKGSSARKMLRQEQEVLYRDEVLARTLLGAQTEHPFHERLVRFFSNVFTVSTSRRECVGLVGPFEREVIRAGVHGSFSDLLVSATQHPAMLIYLDNIRSIGPDSTAGSRRGRGLNENLARELLELHTLGVGHYTQEDVEALANILTGWTVDPEGRFRFSAQRHQPGTQTLLGKRYTGGLEQGEAALRDLARHPATAQRLSWRMAQHFIADDPPSAVVADLRRTFLDSGGDLSAMAGALIDSKAAWSGPLTKLRQPEELVIATMRAIQPARTRLTTEQRDELVSILKTLGQVPWSAPSPEGWPDTAPSWLGGDALLSRLQWTWEMGRLAALEGIEPLQLVDDVLPDLLPRQTLQAVKAAPDRQTGIALLLASPSFQRR